MSPIAQASVSGQQPTALTSTRGRRRVIGESRLRAASPSAKALWRASAVLGLGHGRAHCSVSRDRSPQGERRRYPRGLQCTAHRGRGAPCRVAWRHPVAGQGNLTGSFQVESGSSVHLPDIPAGSLSGVLRSEIETYLRTELSRYLRNPDVTARFADALATPS